MSEETKDETKQQSPEKAMQAIKSVTYKKN